MNKCKPKPILRGDSLYSIQKRHIKAKTYELAWQVYAR